MLFFCALCAIAVQLDFKILLSFKRNNIPTNKHYLLVVSHIGGSKVYENNIPDRNIIGTVFAISILCKLSSKKLEHLLRTAGAT